MLKLNYYTSLPLQEQKSQTACLKESNEEKRAEKPEKREEQKTRKKTANTASREVCGIEYTHSPFERGGLIEACGQRELHADENSRSE